MIILIIVIIVMITMQEHVEELLDLNQQLRDEAVSNRALLKEQQAEQKDQQKQIKELKRQIQKMEYEGEGGDVQRGGPPRLSTRSTASYPQGDWHAEAPSSPNRDGSRQMEPLLSLSIIYIYIYVYIYIYIYTYRYS